jgi:hypothetical protein
MLQFLSFLGLETPILALSDVSRLITSKVVPLLKHAFSLRLLHTTTKFELKLNSFP